MAEQDSSTADSCATCVFHAVVMYGGLVCRRFPPVAYVRHYERDGYTERETTTERPAVDLEDWCGEFRPIK